MGDKMYEFGFKKDRSRIKAKLTPKQESNVNPEDSSSLWVIGVVSPEQIVGYSCKHCDKSFEEAPKLKIFIGSDGEPYHVAAHYYCSSCDEMIFYSFLRPEIAKKIPEEFILIDETGDFKKPTPDSIEELFQEIAGRATKGEGSDLNSPIYSWKVLSRWCEKIGYDIDPVRISNVHAIWKEAYLEKFKKNLPELVQDILGNNRFNFHYDPTAENDRLDYFSSPLPEQLDNLFETLPLITLPDNLDLKMKILKIHQLYLEMFETAQELVKEKRSELDEKISGLEETILNVAKTASKFALQANLTFEQSESAKKISFEEEENSS